MRTFFNQVKRRLLVSFLILLQMLQILAQPGSHWTVGKHTAFTNHFAMTSLAIASDGYSSLRALSFVSRVGGVSFDGVAAPADGTTVSSFNLKYDPNEADGQRLKIVVNNESYTSDLPDWQLIPIAKYANSYNTACVTLFGPESDSLHEHIQFHASFQNSLLGMRILQSDIMLIDPIEYHEVFQYGGHYLLGRGEMQPDANKAMKAAEGIEYLIYAFQQAGKGYHSYVLTDAGIKIRFSTDANSFYLTGDPYYYFFKYGANHEVLPSTEMNRSFKKLYAEISEMNPLVYESVSNTMKYAALFRYVKQNYPARWQTFLQSVWYVRPKPQVVTPTAMPRPR